MQETLDRRRIWPVHVVNMAGNDVRLEACARQLDGQGIVWSRLDAVNGRALDAAALAACYSPDLNRKRAKHPLVRPEIGCFLSHVKAWRLIAAGDAPGAVVLEDDFLAAPDFADVLAALAADDGGWDMVKLFTFRESVRLSDERALTGRYRLGRPYRVPSTTLGYAVTRQAAARLAANALPIARPVDEELKFFWEHDLKVSLVLPNPLTVGEQATDLGTVGDVRKKAARDDGRGMVERVTQSLRYRLSYAVGLHMANLRRRFT